MTKAVERWELGLEQPGSADPSDLRDAIAFAAVIVAATVVVVSYGRIPLAQLPHFATFQSAFVLVVDVITGWMLLGQFRYLRRPLFAILGAAYLFSGLVLLPFLFSFPGALKSAGSVVGGPQSSAWVWHLWHILFPALIALALAVDARQPEARVAAGRVRLATIAAIGAAVALSLLVSVAAIAWHDALPPLIFGTPGGPTAAFFVVGITAAVVTAVPVAMAGVRGWRTRTLLHMWLAVALLAMLADVAGSLASRERYTVGWYFGRVESMVAASVLLAVFVARINRLYRHLAAVMHDLSGAHSRLIAVVAEKDALVESLRQSEEHVRHMAYFDALTALPNRRLLLDRLGQARSQASRRGASMAVLFMDLDRFKEINDALGHDVGDELLGKVATRLAGCVRDSDTVARSGGDEFVIVLPEIAHSRDAALVAEKAIGALAEPVVVGRHRLTVTTSIGIAIFPDDDGGDDVRELMKKADKAMYAAKDAGRNAYRFYAELVALP